MVPVFSLLHGTLYSDKYFTYMRSMVPDIQFMTDREMPGTQPLRYGWPTWWAKMEFFSPEMERFRPMLYMDLDTLILGDINPMRRWDGQDLWTMRCPYRKNACASGIMLIPKDVGDVWDTWIKDPKDWMRRLHGDQNFIGRFPRKVLQLSYPGLYSYKAHCKHGCPKDARIVYFHGYPKPHNAGGWAGELWAKHTQPSTTSETSTRGAAS